MTGNRMLITTAAIICLGAGAALGTLLLWPANRVAVTGWACGGDNTFMGTGTLCREMAPPPQLLVGASREEESATDAAPVMATPVAAVPAEPATSPETASAPADSAPAGRGGFLVVVGSYAQREQAEDRRRALGWSHLDITEATVQGRPYYRVTIRNSTREQAARALNAARSAGIGDAWIMPVPGSTSTAPDTAIAARAV